MNPLEKVKVAYREKKLLQQELPEHLHDWCEIVYVYKGSGTFFIDHIFYEMHPGDCFLIMENVIHRAFPNAANPVTSTALFFHPGLIRTMDTCEGFDLLHIFQEAAQNRRFKLELSLEDRLTLQHYMDEIQAERKSQYAGFQQAILFHLHLLLLHLNRSFGSARANPIMDNAPAPDWLKQILQFINAHPQGELGLTALCKRAAITPSHFSRIFKLHTGMSVTEYVNAKRILHAQRMLKESMSTVQQAAERSGFESLSYFHKLFKKQTGLTPLAYQRKQAALYET